MSRRALFSVGVWLLGLGACSSGEAPPDLGALPDVGAPADLATGEPGPRPDLAPAPPDLGHAPPDLAPPTPPGLTWPAGQSFPSFAPVEALDVIDLTLLPADQQTLVVTLAGLVNRTRPRLYTIDDGGEGKSFWLDQLAVPKTPQTDPGTLVLEYRSEIAGAVVYDEALPDTVNLATTIAGVENGIVVSPSLAEIVQAPPFSLPILLDLRKIQFADKIDVYHYLLTQYGGRASHRLVCGLDPSVRGHLRDYAVATQALVLWLDPRDAGEKALLQQFLALLDPLSPYLGWWPDEGTGVSAASSAGIPVFAADWASNLSVFGGAPRAITIPAAPAAPPLGSKIYVALVMSDGDNLQENQHLLPLKWRDAKRGQVPIAWTTNAALVDAAPLVLDYYGRTASANDVLVSGPSGLGYTYPEWWESSAFDAYAARSGAYLEAAGLRAITVWNKDPLITSNDGKDLNAANATSFVTHLPHLLGLTLQGGWIRFLHESSILDGKLPLLRLAQTYGNNEAELEQGIDAGASLWSHLGPVFIAVQGNMNSDQINPTTFYNVQEHYAGNGDFVFVRLDHLFQLMRQANGLPVDP